MGFLKKGGNFFFIFVKTVAKPLRGRDLNRFPIVRMTLNLILRKFKPKYVIVDGYKIILDRDDSLRLSIVGVYEPLMFKLFKEKIKPGDTVVDVGGHIGYYTIAASKKTGDKGKVYVFEPEKNNFDVLSQNVKINNCKNVILIDKAVAETEKEAELFISPINEGHHSLVDNGGRKRISVKTVSLDNFFGKKSDKVAVIKMDIEGGEYLATLGMKNILRGKDVTLFTEFFPHALMKSNHSPLGYLSLLRKYGFSLYVIDEAKGIVSPVNAQKLLLSSQSSPGWHVNLLATKV